MSYLKCADILKDEDNLRLLDVVDYPQAQKKTRKEIFKRLSKFKMLIQKSRGLISYGELRDKVKRAMNG